MSTNTHPAPIFSDKRCLGLWGGNIGMKCQVLSLVEWLRPLEHQLFCCRRKKRLRWLPRWFSWGIEHQYADLAPLLEQFDKKRPQVLICCGKDTLPLAQYLLQQPSSQGKIFAIYIQNPRCLYKLFDAILVLPHDRLHLPQCIPLTRALYALSHEQLQKYEGYFPSPWCRPTKIAGFLLGGDSKYGKLDKACCERIISIIRKAHTLMPCIITVSARTPELLLSLLRQHFTHIDGILLNIDHHQRSDYLATLHASSVLFVTNDSVNMMSEAFCRHRKVYLIEILKNKRAKPSVFSQSLLDAEMAYIATDQLTAIDHEPCYIPDDCEHALSVLSKLYAQSND